MIPVQLFYRYCAIFTLHSLISLVFASLGSFCLSAFICMIMHFLVSSVNGTSPILFFSMGQLYFTGSRSRFISSVMLIRMNYFTDQDPRKKLLISIFSHKSQVFKILWNKWCLFTGMLHYMRLAKVERRQLRMTKVTGGRLRSHEVG